MDARDANRRPARRTTSAETIARALGGHPTSGGWTVRCPAHDDRTPSLSIRHTNDDKVLVHCHAGCDQQRVIAAVRARGLWVDGDRLAIRHEVRSSSFESKPGRDDARRSEVALATWQSAKPAQGTLVEVYLASRGTCLGAADALRFHADLKHPSGGFWPAMVALVTEGVDATPLAIHRTFLAGDGGKASVEPQKMMLGPCRGGVVRLATPGEVLMAGRTGPRRSISDPGSRCA